MTRSDSDAPGGQGARAAFVADADHDAPYDQSGAGGPSPVAAGLRGRCPRCGQGRLFCGFLALAPRCEACGLDYSFADAADGPAVFVILIAGGIVLGAALWLEFAFEPSPWVHLLVTAPFAAAICLGMLRVFKGAFVALQYANKAEQGRLAK